jgi:Protein tyrosine and serine/threonine kinase
VFGVRWCGLLFSWLLVLLLSLVLLRLPSPNRNLRHPNVLQYLGTSVEESGMCIIMEYMPRGSLYRLIHNPKLELDLKMIKRTCARAVTQRCGLGRVRTVVQYAVV